MGKALQTIAGFYTAGGAGTGIATAATGDSFTVPSGEQSGKVYLENVFAAGASTDFVRVRSNRLHDVAQGIRLSVGATKYRPLMAYGMGETLQPADVPIVEIDETGAATGGILLYYGYDDLGGINPRLSDWPSVQARADHLMGCEVDVTSGAIGQWGVGVALNGTFNNFSANTDYALLGYSVSVGCLGIAVTGIDTGQQKIGGPGDPDPILTSRQFVRLSQETGRPYIPIINANNAGSTFVQAVDVAAATATHVTLQLLRLK